MRTPLFHLPVTLMAGLLAFGALVVAGPSPSQAPPPAQPTFRSAVTAVTTDVITRDSGGRFVSDLTKDDFVVLEDGQPQTITSFALVHGGRTYTGLAAPETVAAPEGIVLPKQRRTVEDVAGRVVVIFVDDVHIEAEYTPHVKRIIEQVSQELLHDGDMVAMISSGPSSIATGLTYDRKLVSASASRIRGNGLTAREIFSNLEGAQGPVDLRNRAQVAFYSAYNLLADLENVQNKRKVLLYISAGYDFDPYAEGRNSTDRIQGGRFSDPLRFLYQNQQDNPYMELGRVTADIDLYQYMRELILAANRTNTSIYAVDPRGLQGVVGADQYLDQSEWRTHIQKTQSTLRLMSEATGGFAVVNVNDFPSEFKKIDAETSDYYILGFTSSNPDVNRRVRELDVQVKRPGVAVAARKAYSLKTPGPVPTPGATVPVRKK